MGISSKYSTWKTYPIDASSSKVAYKNVFSGKNAVFDKGTITYEINNGTHKIFNIFVFEK